MFYFAGGDLCEVSCTLRGSLSAAGGAELSCHCYSQRNGSGGEVRLRSIVVDILIFVLFTLFPVFWFCFQVEL